MADRALLSDALSLAAQVDLLRELLTSGELAAALRAWAQGADLLIGGWRLVPTTDDPAPAMATSADLADYLGDRYPEDPQ